MNKLLELHCSYCGAYWDFGQPDACLGIGARELGDGSICLSCPTCRLDLAVVAPPRDCSHTR
jgi:hypothetical protein